MLTCNDERVRCTLQTHCLEDQQLQTEVHKGGKEREQSGTCAHHTMLKSSIAALVQTAY